MYNFDHCLQLRLAIVVVRCIYTYRYYEINVLIIYFNYLIWYLCLYMRVMNINNDRKYCLLNYVIFKVVFNLLKINILISIEVN